MKIDKLFIHINLNFKSTTDGRGRVLTGISPRHGSHAALPIACAAIPNIVRLYARTVAVREYQYTDSYVIARKLPISITALFYRSAFPVGESIMAHKPPGSAQIECIRFAIFCAAVILRAFFVKQRIRLIAIVSL